MSALSDLSDQVTKTETSITAAIAALGAESDATALADLAARLAASQAALDTAVAAKST